MKNHTLVVDSGCSQCVCGNGFTIEKLHGKWIQAGIAIAETATAELRVCDAYAKTYVLENPFILLIKNGLEETKIQGQDESLLYPCQARDYGSIVDDVAHIHDGNQRIYASNMNIPLKYDGKDMCITVNKTTKNESEALQVMQLTGSSRFTPPNVNQEHIKRIGNLKIKPHHFENL